jgi:hypothetical protein
VTQQERVPALGYLPLAQVPPLPSSTHFSLHELINSFAGGGSHGGNGCMNSGTNALAYDSVTVPTLPGSAGGYNSYIGSYTRGFGGGVISLTATYLTVDGNITADGTDGVSAGSGGRYVVV